jgi:hypothetical protein
MPEVCNRTNEISLTPQKLASAKFPGSILINALVLTDRVCIVAETLRVRQERSSAAILSKSGSDPGPIDRVKEFLRGSRTGCQYR